MARMNRPAPVEVCYKNMRFLITHNPTNATLSTFLEVRMGGWKGDTRTQLCVLGLKADIEIQQGSVLCRMRQRDIAFGTMASGGIPGWWVPPHWLLGVGCFGGRQMWCLGMAEMEQSFPIPVASPAHHVTGLCGDVHGRTQSPSPSIRSFHPKYPSVFPVPGVRWVVHKELEGSVLREPRTVPILGALPPALAAART